MSRTDRPNATCRLPKKSGTGFTLIELLVVIAIIGLLSSIVLASLNTARGKGRDAKRLSDLQEVQKALELYALNNAGKYPCSGVGGSCSGIVWLGACTISATWGTGGQGVSGANAWVPNVAPTYINQLPTDPKPNTNTCYIYRSDGTNYMLLAHGTVETYTVAAGNPAPRLVYDGNSATCPTNNQPYQRSFAFYTTGGACW